MAWVAAFSLALAIDYVVARYTACVAARRVAWACIWSALCAPLGYYSFVICLDDWHALVPLSLGHAAGTALALVPARRRRKKMGRPRKPNATAYFTPDNCPVVWCLWIDLAKEEVLVFAATLSSVAIAMSLEDALRRGCEVRLLIGPEEDYSATSQAGQLQAAGAKVSVDANHPILAERTVVIDQEIVLTGNFPLTPSADLNCAASFVVLAGDRRLAAAYRDNFLHHESHSRPRKSLAERADSHAA
jgi:phosphatidylserine/phosphatidylglycerophosphate/cardiolipin synthase-like enzyme